MESRLPELRDLVDQIDRLVPREGAKLRIPGDADGTTTIGTQLGYLRVGVEFLRAGLAAEEPEATEIPLDIAYLLTPGSRTPFEVCELDEDVERLPPPKRKLGALGQLVAALVTVAVVGLLLVGVAAVLGWLRRVI